MLTKDQKNALAESILNCIEEAITPKFGENVSRVIFANFEVRFGFKKKEIVFHSKEFELVLDGIFGTGIASQLVKRSIFKELSNRFRIFGPDYFERNFEKQSIISKAVEHILKTAE